MNEICALLIKKREEKKPEDKKNDDKKDESIKHNENKSEV
jgi:hypothetical protein